MFSINRSLCEVEFIDKDMKDMDIDIFEYVWFKIRDNFQNPTDNFTIKFTELSKGIGKYLYENKPLSESINRMGKITIKTNIKSELNQKRFTFEFSVFRVKNKVKGFTVNFDENIFKLFDKPKSYNEYNQNNIYNLNTKHSKLLYKFIIGYRFLNQRTLFVYSDTLTKIMNIKSDKDWSYIKSSFIDKSIKEITEKSDIEISIKKVGYEFKNEKEIVKYKVTIDKYKGTDMSVDLRQRKRNTNKPQSEVRLDEWIKNLKDDVDDYDRDSKKIPMVGIYNSISHLPIYIDNDYRLTNSLDYYSDNSSQTMDIINSWIENDELDYGVEMVDGYSNNLEKLCLLQPFEIKKRGLV